MLGASFILWRYCKWISLRKAESKLYRDLVQRELSKLEGVPNLWKTEKYCDNKHNICISRGSGFGGYVDWVYPKFDAKISIRADHEHNFENFKVGTYGLCISCGCEISNGLYCSDCDSEEREFCQECEASCRETWEVINCHGERIHICKHCLNEYYQFCEHCEEYRPRDEISVTGDGSNVCHRCLTEDYMLCNECDEYYLADEVSPAVDSQGKYIYVCRSCRDEHYVYNNERGKYCHEDFIEVDTCSEEVSA